MGKINVKAKQQYNSIAKKDLFILNTEATYSTIPAHEVMKEVAEKLNQPLEVIQMNMSAIKKIIESHVCNGHSVEIPFVGHMRFGFTSSAVEKASDVKKSLIKSYKLVFVPSVEIKQLLKNTRINITIYDKQGNIIGTATDTDSDVEDTAGNDQTTGGGNSQQGNQQQGGGSQNNGGGTQNGGSGTQNVEQYTITYTHNGSTHTTQTYAVGAAVTAPAAPDGYIWLNVPSVMPSRNVTCESYEAGDPNDI